MRFDRIVIIICELKTAIFQLQSENHGTGIVMNSVEFPRSLFCNTYITFPSIILLRNSLTDWW